MAESNVEKPFYCGISTHKFLNGKPIKGNWPSIVSIKDIKTINVQLDANKQSKHPAEHQLQSQLICGNCGGKMTGYVKKKHSLL